MYPQPEHGRYAGPAHPGPAYQNKTLVPWRPRVRSPGRALTLRSTSCTGTHNNDQRIRSSVSMSCPLASQNTATSSIRSLGMSLRSSKTRNWTRISSSSSAVT